MLRGISRDRARNELRTRLAFRFSDLPMATGVARGHRATQEGATISLVLLGTPRLELADRSSVPLERRMAALLAKLAVDGPTPRAQAAAMLWPDVDDKSARNNLRQRLFRLRQAARRDVVLPDTTLALADGIANDLTDLGARLADDPKAASGELLGALNFDDCLELADWVAVAREQWAVARRSALAEIASRLEAEGQIAPALRYAERLVSDDPLLEHAHRRLMRLHYLRGDRAAALSAYERCRDLLHRELNARPGSETLDLVRVIEDSQTPKLEALFLSSRPMTVLRPPRLVGRDNEWTSIEHAWHGGRVTIVSGEPGIGKSRLAADWCAASECAMFGARPGDARVAYALIARVLRGLFKRCGMPKEAWVIAELARLLPELGVEPTTKFQALKVEQAVKQSFVSAVASGTTGIVIDDMQLADDSSLELLLRLMSNDAAGSVAWLVTVRSNEMPALLVKWKSEVETGAVNEVHLGPLSDPAVRSLLESLAVPGFDVDGWAEPMARHTGGNPMFILETLLAMLARGGSALDGSRLKLPAPAHIGQLIERRLDQLSAPALRLARVAALAGQDFSVELAVAVLQQHALDIADAWRELEGAQVIRGNAFAHDLIYEATLRTVPQAIACVLHQSIAEFLEASGAQPARIAGHYYEAKQWSQAGAHYKIAADRARSTSFGANAADLYRRAADSFERAGQRTERIEVMRMLATCMQHMKRFAEYAAMGQQMTALAVTPQERLWSIDVLAKSQFELTHDDESIQLLRQGRLLARELGDVVIETSLAEWEALGLSFKGRQAEARELDELLLGLIQAHPHDETIALRKRQYAYLLEMDNRFEPAIELLHEADQRARTDGDLGLVSEIQVIRGACLYNLGQLDAAIDEYFAARRLQIENAGGGTGWTTYDVMLGRYLQEAGRYREAHELLENALESHGPADDWFRAQCQATLAHCFITLGQWARAQRLLGATRPGDSVARAVWLHAKVRVSRFEDKPRRALLDELAEHVVTCPRSERLLWQARTELARELDAAEAAALARQVMEQSLAKLTCSAYLPAKAILVDALRRAGETGMSAHVAGELIDDLERFAAIGMYPAEYRWIIFQAFDAAGKKSEARMALGRGDAWVRSTVQSHVADEFKDSFLERNPVNRAIRTAVTRMPR
jgi:DNA-binding SARP family transcriptional activator